jgi:predicted nucleic acid-binding protein
MKPTPGKVFVDTNIWLYALIKTQDPDKHDLASQRLEQSSNVTVSTQVINEVAVNLLKKARVDEAFIQNLIRQWFEAFEVIPADQEQLLLASTLRSSLNLSYWDSLIVASALSAGCETLYTEDLQHGQVIQERLRIVNPFKEG